LFGTEVPKLNSAPGQSIKKSLANSSPPHKLFSTKDLTLFGTEVPKLNSAPRQSIKKKFAKLLTSSQVHQHKRLKLVWKRRWKI